MTTRKQAHKWGCKPQVENRDGRLIFIVSTVDLRRHWRKITRQIGTGTVDVIEVWQYKEVILHIVPPPTQTPPVRLEVGEFKFE